jgi:hypothetical protein
VPDHFREGSHDAELVPRKVDVERLIRNQLRWTGQRQRDDASADAMVITSRSVYSVAIKQRQFTIGAKRQPLPQFAPLRSFEP